MIGWFLTPTLAVFLLYRGVSKLKDKQYNNGEKIEKMQTMFDTTVCYALAFIFWTLTYNREVNVIIKNVMILNIIHTSHQCHVVRMLCFVYQELCVPVFCLSIVGCCAMTIQRNCQQDEEKQKKNTTQYALELDTSMSKQTQITRNSKRKDTW